MYLPSYSCTSLQTFPREQIPILWSVIFLSVKIWMARFVMAIKIYHTRTATRYAARFLGSVTLHGLCADKVTVLSRSPQPTLFPLARSSDLWRPPLRSPLTGAGWGRLPPPSRGWVASEGMTLLRTPTFPTRAVYKVFGLRKGTNYYFLTAQLHWLEIPCLLGLIF